MMTFQSIEPLWGLSGIGSAPVETTGERNQPTMFTDIFHSMIDNVKETDAAKNKAYYALATGQLDNPAEATIAAAQASLSVSLLVQMRNKALESYNELMRIGL